MPAFIYIVLSAYVLPLRNSDVRAVASARSGAVTANGLADRLARAKEQQKANPGNFIDNRKGAQGAAAKPDTAKYGHDPRDALEPAAYVADTGLAIGATGTVGTLTTVNELQAALDVAAERNALVSLKFVRDGCPACASTRELFIDAAKECGEKGIFFEVDFNAAKALCRLCELKFVPSGHVYSGGVLQHTSGLGKKSWDTYKEGLDEVRESLA